MAIAELPAPQRNFFFLNETPVQLVRLGYWVGTGRQREAASFGFRVVREFDATPAAIPLQISGSAWRLDGGTWEQTG